MRPVNRVTVDRGMLDIDGERVRWLSGSIHYWRHDVADWPRLLDGAREVGVTMVDTYVPWEVHESSPGERDFEGRLDIARFIEMAGDRGLRVSVRPGPACGAELPTHGYPRHVVDQAEVQALRCSGRPYVLPSASHFFKVPSYASTRFLSQVRSWYDELGQRLADYQAPGGPIAAIQVDNEMGFFFQAHAYALDYHPECLRQWRDFVLGLHGSLDAVNAAYGSTAASPADLDPPRDGSDPSEVRRVEWLLFREHHVRSTLRRLRDALVASGFDCVVTFHNDYARTETPLDQGALEQSDTVDVAGIDAYSSRKGGPWLSDIGRHLSASSRLPLMPELGSGWIAMPWLIPAAIDARDQEMVAMATFAAGVRGANFYMLADRDRWYGSPMDIHGNLREAQASFLRRFREFLDEAQLEELERVAPLLILEPRAEFRREAARAVLGDIVPAYREVMPFDFGLADPGSSGGAAREWFGALQETARRAEVDFDLGAASSPPCFERYQVAAVPVLECLDSATIAALEASPSTRLLVGGRLPAKNERLQQLGPLPSVLILGSADELSAHLPQPTAWTGDAVAAVFHWRGAERSVLVALNHSDKTRQVNIETTAEGSWRSLWPRSERVARDASEASSAVLPAYGVMAWEVAA